MFVKSFNEKNLEKNYYGCKISIQIPGKNLLPEQKVTNANIIILTQATSTL